MNQGDLQAAELLFLELIELDPSRRESVLLERCGGDSALLAEVRGLLENHVDDEHFLDPVEVRGLAKGLTAAEDVPLPPGIKLGDYTIQGVLGQGGMGIVYLAQQEKPRRTVAIKLMRASMFGSSAMRRFEHEAEVLGMLQHPGIAQIFEAGTAEAGYGPQPYIAMEFIDGPTLSAYVRDRGLSDVDRLRLMAEVCDAVHHAHQRGVIHRDLKPGNILVTPQGRPKVLDFGVSRATGADRRATMHTSAGQLIGTLAYMSPEQAGGETDQIDVRADVYSLGVMLFEMLTGQLPFDIRTKPIAEAARIIHDTEPRRLTVFGRKFRGDLDTIVATAIEKDRFRRYQSAADLAEDIRRHLDGQPITAKQDSLLYVLKKQVRRHKVASALLAGLVISVTTLGIFSTIQAYKAQRSAHEAIVESDKARRALEVANLERARADVSALRAESDLRASNIERGRLLGFSSGMVLAEDAIWPELIRDPSSVHAFWALWELYNGNPCRAAVRAHDSAVHGAVFSRDGGYVVTAGDDGDIKLWETATGRFVLRIASGVVLQRNLLFFSPDGARLIAVDLSGRGHVWRTTDWQCEASFEALPVVPLVASLSQDGSRFAVGGQLGMINVFDTSNWTLRWRGIGHRDTITGVAFSPDAERLATGSNDQQVRLWDVGTGGLLDTWPAHAQGVSALSWSPDGRWIVTGGADREVRVWDASIGVTVARYDASNGSIGRVPFSPDSKKIAIAGWWRVDVVDFENWKLETSLFGHRRGTHAVSWSPDSASIVTGSVEPEFRLWDLPSHVGPQRYPAHGHRVTAVQMNPGGDRVVSAAFDRSVVLWDWPSMTKIRKYAGGGAYGTCAAFIGDGSKFAYLTDPGPVYICNSSDGSVYCTIPGRRVAAALGASPDGKTLYIADARNIVVSWDVESGRMLETWGLEGRDPLWMRISKDGSRMDMTQRDFVWQSWSLPTMAPIMTYRPSTPSWSLAVANDDSIAAMTNWESNIELWDHRNGVFLGVLEGHRQLISGCEFSPSARFLLTASTDGGVKWWDVANRRAVATLHTSDSQPMNAVTLANDHRTVISGGYDGALYVWDLGRFDRHIAGNLEARIGKLRRTELPNPAAVERLRAWASRVLDAVAGLAEPPHVGGPGQYGKP